MDVGQYTIDDLTVGTGTVWRVLDARGWSHDQVRAEPTELPRNHGGVDPDGEWAGFRTWELDLFTSGAREDVQARWLDVQERLQPGGDIEFGFRRPGETDRVSFVRPRAPVPVFEAAARVCRVRVRLHASDPAIYSATLTETVLEPFVGTTFANYLDMAGSYPKLYGAGGSGGGVTVTNGGRFESWPRFEIEGPTSGTMTVESLENVDTGGRLAFTADGGLSIPSGSTLIVDTHPARRMVAFTTGASRLNTVADLGAWWPLPPGTSEVRFRAGGSTAGAQCLVLSRSAWL